jgi:uracil-DNA glycosylase
LPEEFANCRPYLARELQALGSTRVVIALGKVAFDQYLRACRDSNLVQPRPALKFQHGAFYKLPWGVSLLGSFHPSQQNTFTGKLTRPMFHKIFQHARAILDAT